MLRIRQVKLPIEDTDYKTKISKVLKVNINDIKNIKIVKKSIDARDKNNLLFVYEFDVEVSNEERILSKNKSNDIFITPDEEYKYVFDGVINTNERPIIIGSGPAGLFCAYTLVTHGIKPIVIERGEKVEDRVKSVEEFWKSNKLNKNSNVQFGEGGAGTFSDGKLNTSIKDHEHRIKHVLETFVSCGANEDILYDAKPHIGTDILREVVKNLREKIISLGGEFRYNTTLTDVNISNNRIESITLNNTEIIPCNILVLAIGHSARDTFEMLSKKVDMTSKPFAVGVRVIHNQKMINKSQYGVEESKYLSPASYKLTYTTTKGRGVYSFCMCPGGYVVNASSEENRLVVNGMSNYKRETSTANSAIIVTVNPRDFGNNPLDGLEFQRRLEEKAYTLGRGNIPTQTYIDYKNNITSTNIGSVEPITKGNITLSNLNELFPDYINEALKEALPEFGKKIKGYDRDDTLLLGVESRTSSPIKIIRNEKLESNVTGIYPCGEGAGYAGGITSAATDGIKVAEQIGLLLKK